jgi:hypothetical protein
MDILATDGISIGFDRTGGIIDDLVIRTDGGQELRPLHKAPWVRNGEALPETVAPIERRLAGDFFCAPFATAVPGVPIHGWAANGQWEKAETPDPAPEAVTATYVLRQRIQDAQLTKQITLRAGHPIVYQTHIFAGGTGYIPIAHHAMLHVPGGAQLSFSKKSAGRTPEAALETDPVMGRSILAYPQRFDSLETVQRIDGSEVDVSFYPFDTRHEDLIVLSEAPDVRIGWSAALARSEGFVFFAVKDALRLPQTVLWLSNGGRSYAPWNGRHIAVIGIEEAAVSFHLPENDGGEEGLETGLSLAPGRTTSIRYAFGAIAVPAHWTRVADIAISAGTVTLTDVSGDSRSVPFHDEHLM